MSERRDDVFKALADEHRRRILSALCARPMIAGDLGRLVQLAPNAVSFHLKWLRAAGLVSVRREGRYLRYHANVDTLSRWRLQVDELFASSESDGKAAASSTPQTPAERIANPPRYSAPVESSHSDGSSDDELPTELL